MRVRRCCPSWLALVVAQLCPLGRWRVLLRLRMQWLHAWLWWMLWPQALRRRRRLVCTAVRCWLLMVVGMRACVVAVASLWMVPLACVLLVLPLLLLSCMVLLWTMLLPWWRRLLQRRR